METKEENKFYINVPNNKVVRVTNGTTLIYYQIKQYENGDIKHSSGKKIFTNPNLLQHELEYFTTSTEEVFKKVATDYYAKEKENAEKSRKYLLGSH